MRYPAEHKEQSRLRLLTHGGEYAKKHGFASSGMDALAAAAGVTTGAVYKHFTGKSDLFAALVGVELERTAWKFSKVPRGDADAAGRVLAAYLSVQHAAHPEVGCVLPSLTPEVARADNAVREAFRTGLVAVHEVVADRFTGSGERAWALIAQCVGAVMLARAMGDTAAGRELLVAAREQCAALLRPDESGDTSR